MNERALSKANRDRYWGIAEMMLEEFRDRPYMLPLPKSNEHFDYEKIDKVSHRLGEIPIKKGRELKKLYKENKLLFYSELEKLIPEVKVYGAMLQQIEFLPFISDLRKAIFKELVDLYISKKWFGFYALGLTQVEGLFTEMCKLCEPSFNNPYAALPDKVNTVRPYHQYSENRFDYFQYYFPNLRNRFLHYGIDTNENIELLAKELLYDLEEVSSIYVQLNIEALSLLRIIRKRDDTEFMHTSGLSFYFTLLASVKKSHQFHYFEKEIKELNEIYLPDVIFKVVWDLDEKIKKLIETIYDPLKVQSSLNGYEVDLHKITLQEISDNKEKIRATTTETIKWQFQSEVEALKEILQFFESYKKHLDLSHLSEDLKAKIEELYTQHSLILKKIKLIELQLQ